MIEVKSLLVIDDGTEVPVVALCPQWTGDQPVWLRAGFGATMRYVLLVDLTGNFATSDPYAWPERYGRTMRLAHHMLNVNWPSYRDGERVDVRHSRQMRAEMGLL